MKIEVRDKRVPAKENVFLVDMPQCPREGEGFELGGERLTVREVTWRIESIVEHASIIVR
jgi:hypothetical protein